MQIAPHIVVVDNHSGIRNLAGGCNLSVEVGLE